MFPKMVGATALPASVNPSSDGADKYNSIVAKFKIMMNIGKARAKWNDHDLAVSSP